MINRVIVKSTGLHNVSSIDTHDDVGRLQNINFKTWIHPIHRLISDELINKILKLFYLKIYKLFTLLFFVCLS